MHSTNTHMTLRTLGFVVLCCIATVDGFSLQISSAASHRAAVAGTNRRMRLQITAVADLHDTISAFTSSGGHFLNYQTVLQIMQGIDSTARSTQSTQTLAARRS
jgi:hypothetical protein